MAWGQIPGWPLVSWGQGIRSASSSTSSSSSSSSSSSTTSSGATCNHGWGVIEGPSVVHGFRHIYPTNVHSNCSVGVDYTYIVSIQAPWFVQSDNDVYLSTATLRAI